MIDQRALLVRYQVLATNRRHFELLFFATVAFVLAYAFLVPIAWAAGPILMAGGLIAQRLLKRERSCFAAMLGCWTAIAGEPLTMIEAKFRPGAMALIVVGLYCAGFTLFVWQGARGSSY